MTKQICYRKLRGYKYELLQNYRINVGIKEYDFITKYLEMSASGLLSIKKGYSWDGASGPTIDTVNSMRGSLIHDALYQLIRLKKLPESCRKQADNLLEQLCLDDGMWKVRANLWERAVRWFAKWSCTPGSEKPEEIFYAP